MGFLSFLKQSIPHLSKTSPAEKFDLTSVEGIRAIPLSAVSKSMEFSTEQIEYILQRKATQYKAEGNLDLAIECLKKANELMPLSHTIYPAKEYYRLVEYLKLARRFDEAREEKAKLDRQFNGNGLPVSLLQKVQERNTPPPSGPDLVEVGFVGCCCSECAKYRDRVYSYYGKDPRFPRFPQFLMDNPGHCGLIVMPFYFEYCSFRNAKDQDLRGAALIKYSNRAFRDNRSPEEKALYETKIKETEAARIDRQSYDWLWEFMPEKCPKSYGGYRRMKNANSANFQKLQAAALKEGFDLLRGKAVNSPEN